LTLNIQLIFVFDGPGVPGKIRWKGKRGIAQRPELLKQVLECLGVPYQVAPAEAEAECAELQKFGKVDAVWSGDADALMFGCDLLISDHRIAKEHGDQDRSKGHTEKSKTHVQIIRAQKMKEELAIDREKLVLFAILAGGDYHPGLSGCGAGLAQQVVQEGTLARELCECRNQLDCTRWRTKLTAVLRNYHSVKGMVVPPPDFPQYDVLKQYCRPTVTPGHLLRKARLDLAFSRPLQERELLQVTSSRFNIWGKLYMDHVGPILLTRALVQKDSASLNNILQGIKPKKQHKSDKAEVMELRSVQRAIRFCPFEVTTLQRTDFEDGNLKGMWVNKRGVPFDPGYVVECDHFPAILLQYVESQTMSDPLPAVAKQKLAKRKEQSDGNIPTKNPTKRIKSSAPSEVEPTTNIARPTELGLLEPQARVMKTPLEPRRPRALPMNDKPVDLTESNDDVDAVLRLPPGRRLTTQSTQSSSTISGSGLPRSLTNEKDRPVDAIRPDVQLPHLSPTNSYITKASKDLSSPYGPRDAPRALRSPAEASSTQPAAQNHVVEQTRAARLKHFTMDPVVSNRGAMSITRTRDEVVKAPSDVIDLTGD
jgi:Holliday junction resolvase YEN1